MNALLSLRSPPPSSRVVSLSTLACVLALSLSACSVYKPDVAQGNIVSSEQVSLLKTGMTRQQVQQTLGSPLLQDVFNANRWDYVYRSLKSNGVLVQRVLTLLFSADGKLLSWAGQEAPEQNAISLKRLTPQPAAVEHQAQIAQAAAPIERLNPEVAALATQAPIVAVFPAAPVPVATEAAPVVAVAASPAAVVAVPTVQLAAVSAPANASNNAKSELLSPDIGLVIAKRVASWSGAWMSKDVASYAAHYVDGYKGDLASPAAWMAQRQKVFDAAGPISVTLTEIRVIQTSSTEARASFIQDYQSNRLKEMGSKNLFFLRTGNDWKIVGERFVKQV
jgi:outer membrane protein assembly factor BamE